MSAEAKSRKLVVDELDALDAVTPSDEEAAGPELLDALLAESGTEVVPQVLEARCLIGGLIAREAARSASVVDKAELRRALEAVRRSKPGRQAHEAENEVHRRLANATGNAVFRLLVDAFIRASEPLRERVHPSLRDPARLADELENLVTAVEAGSPAAAEIAASTYLEVSGSRLAAAVQTSR